MQVTGESMEKSIYKYVIKYTARDQIYLLVLTLVNLPFIYISLEIPKIIINEAIGGQGAPYSILGYSMDQVTYLLFFCVMFGEKVFQRFYFSNITSTGSCPMCLNHADG